MGVRRPRARSDGLQAVFVICLGLAGCASKNELADADAIPSDSIALRAITSDHFGLSDTTEGGYIIAANQSTVSYTPVRFPGVISVDLPSGNVDTIGGISGEGPGELRYPIAIWYAGDTLVVIDRSRSRLLTYLNGTYIDEELIRSNPAWIAPDTGRRLVFASSGGALGGVEVRGGGGIRSFPPRTVPRAPGAIDRVAVIAPGQYALYEATTGSIHFFDDNGSIVEKPIMIPGWLHARLLRRMRSRSEDPDQQGFLGFPEAKFFLGDRMGNIYLFYYLDDPKAGVAVRYSVSSNRWARITPPSDSLSRFMLANAFAGVIVDSRLYVTRSNGVAVFEMEGLTDSIHGRN